MGALCPRRFCSLAVLRQFASLCVLCRVCAASLSLSLVVLRRRCVRTLVVVWLRRVLSSLRGLRRAATHRGTERRERRGRANTREQANEHTDEHTADDAADCGSGSRRNSGRCAATTQRRVSSASQRSTQHTRRFDSVSGRSRRGKNSKRSHRKTARQKPQQRSDEEERTSVRHRSFVRTSATHDALV